MTDVSFDQPVALYQRALTIYGKDPVSWSLLWGLFLGCTLITFGIGSILLPNAFRATRDALRDERGPDLNGLFQFPPNKLLEDAIAAGGVTVASMVVGSIVGPLATVVSMALAPAPAIVTEPDVGGIDALQLAVAYLQREPVPVMVHGLIGAVINLPGACCLFPLVVTLPISGIAHWLFYEQRREAILLNPRP